MVAKKKRKFTKENWENLMATVRQDRPPEEPKKEEAKVEVHVHNNFPEFSQGGNSADNDLKRMTGEQRRRWLQ